MIRLRQLLSEITEDAATTKQAKSLGLKSVGFGRWVDKNGKVTHTTKDGKLQPVGMAKVSTNKPIGTKIASIGAGGKEVNVQTDKEWDKQNPKGKAATEREFNPSIPLAKVSPEWEATKTLHRTPEMRKLRDARIFGFYRPSVHVTKDEYSLGWSNGGYGDEQSNHIVTFNTKDPTKFKVTVQAHTTPGEEEFDDGSYDGGDKETYNKSKTGKGSVKDALAALKALSDEYDKLR